MDDPAGPHLRLVNVDTGETPDVCPHCLATDEYNRRLRAEVSRFKGEERRRASVEARRADIVEVLSFWRDTVAPRAGVVAGSANWKAVSKRLGDVDEVTLEPRFNVLKLKAAVVGITLDPYRMEKGQSYRRHPNEAFKDPGLVDKLIDRAVRFKRQTGVSALELVDELAGEGLRWLAERCSCTHTWLEHLRGGEAAQGGAQACSVEGCSCGCYDFFHAKVERFIKEQE